MKKLDKKEMKRVKGGQVELEGITAGAFINP